MFHTDFSTTFQLNKTSNNQKLAAITVTSHRTIIQAPVEKGIMKRHVLVNGFDHICG